MRALVVSHMGDLTRTVWRASNLYTDGLTGTVGGYSH